MTVYKCDCGAHSDPEPSKGETFGIDFNFLSQAVLTAENEAAKEYWLAEEQAAITEWARRYDAAKTEWERVWFVEHTCTA